MDFLRFRRAVRTYWMIVLASGAGVGLLALAGSYLLATYQVRSEVLIRPIAPDPTLATRPQVGVISPTGLTILQALEASYVALLKSRSLAERVVDRLHKETAAQPAPPPAWKDRARAVVRAATQALRMTVYLHRPHIALSPRDREIQEVTDSINAYVVPKSSVLRITVEHRNADKAARLARLAAETFVEYSQELNARTAVVSRKFLEDQVQQARSDLVAAQAKMDRFRRQQGIFLSLDDEGKQRVTDAITLESLSRTLETDIRQSRDKIRETRRELEAHPKSIPSAATTDQNPMIVQLRTQLLALETRLPGLLADFLPSHPQVVALRAQIEQLRSQLQAEAQRVVTTELTALNPVHQTLLANLAVEEINLQGLSARKAALDALLVQARKELAGLSGHRNTWDLLAQDLRLYAARFDQLVQNLDAASLMEATKLAEIQLLELGAPPQFPTFRSLPLLAFPIVGILLGLLGGCGLAMGLYHFGPSVRDPETARTRLRLPMYGVVDARPDVGLSSSDADAGWNTFRFARARLLAAGDDGRPLTSLVLTGIAPDDDAAEIAARLATVYAESGTRTLLVDCRNHTDDRVRSLTASVTIPALDVLTNGADTLPRIGDPGRIDKLLQLIRSRRAAYGAIMVVTSPINTSADAIHFALSADIDALLLVVWHRRTHLTACQKVKNRLDEVGVHHVGLLYAR